MKKYLPSLEELASGVVIVIVGLVIWNFVSAPILSAINSVKAKAS